MLASFPKNLWRIFSLLCLLSLTLAAQEPQEKKDDLPDANPGRPTIATPATLTPVGYLQIESGVLGAFNSPEFSTRTSLVEVVKLTVSKRLQFLASNEPVAQYHDGGGVTGHGVGDVLLGFQAVVIPGEGAKPTISVSYFRHIYNGDIPDLDIGTPRNSVLVLASADVRGFHYDLNGFFNEVVDGTDHRPQFGQTISISHPLRKGFGLTGELWHFDQPFLQGHTVGNLWAVNYNARKNLVFDLGFNRGLTGTSTRWQVFTGVTWVIPKKLWH